MGAATDAAAGPEKDHSSSPTRVLLVDDHAGFRSMARQLLTFQGFDVIGESGDGVSALDRAVALRPDVVVVDIGLPDLDGFDVAEQLADLDPAPAVVLISSRDTSAYRSRLAGSRARGFLRKDELTGPALRALIG